MKKTSLLFIFLLFIISSSARSQENKFIIDITKSSIEWTARKVTGQHHGTITLASGYLTMKANSLNTGTFTANMGSIKISDLKGKSRENLLNHLKSNTFFAVADYPYATFQIIKVIIGDNNQTNITGSLTIKGITKSLSFPATIKREKNSITAIAKHIKIDRTKYDIKFRSKSFFGDVGDLAIDDEFEISVKLVAKK